VRRRAGCARTAILFQENRLLEALSEQAAGLLAATAERIRLTHGATVYEMGEPFTHAYFPIDAVISVVAVMRDGQQIEALTIGREGVCGAQALLDSTAFTTGAWCQVAGEVYRVPMATFQALCAEDGATRDLIERYLSATVDAMAQSIACNRLHYVSERCARWLLMTYRRVGRPDFPLTHEVLATMLGVRRAGVSIAAAELQRAGVIRYVRGKFTILDPDGLESAACECYGAINRAFSERNLLVA
jgi:CRP-like cAMP-binding protein